MRKSLLILFLVSCSLLHARSYLDAGVRGGLAGLTYDCDYGGMLPGYHVAADVGYLYKSPYWIACRVGATFEASSSTYRKTDYEDQYTTIDVEEQTMQVQYTIGTLRERHSSYAVSFPAQIGFHIDRFTFLVGPRFTLPLGGKWKQTAADAALTVYYPRYDNLVEESYPLAASRNFDMEQRGDMTLPKWQCSLSGELTYDFLVASSYGKAESFLSVGVYFDAGLTTAPTYPDKDRWGILHLTDTRDGFPLSRIMTPVLEAWREEHPLVAKYGNFAVGIKVAYRLTSAPQQRRTHHGCNCDE